MHEGCCHTVGRGVQSGVQGLADKPCRRWFDLDAVERGLGADALLLQGDELLDRAGIGTDFPHGVQVQFEVAAIACAGALIRLFSQYDFIDQASRLRVGRRQPGQVDAGEFALQPLGQRHEVPDGKDMAFHKAA